MRRSLAWRLPQLFGMVNAARSCACGCGNATTVGFISCGGLPRHGAFADDFYVAKEQQANLIAGRQRTDSLRGEGGRRWRPSQAACWLPKDSQPTWQMREWASSTRKTETRSEGLSQAVFKCGLTPELTGAGGPTGPQGTNIGHQNREAMANVGVRVERFVRLGRVGRAGQVHCRSVRFECAHKSAHRFVNSTL